MTDYDTTHFYAMILAGGGGTRLWPLSRKDRPKQMLPLLDHRSMFQMAIDRLEPFLPPERIFVVTGPDYVETMQRSVPHLPRENFIVEPFGRNSGPGAGLGMLHIRQRDPQAIVALLGSDHHIVDVAQFRRVLAAAGQVAARDYIVTLGISASFPSTGFGYIRRGDLLERVGEFEVYEAGQFTEKPDLATAIEFLAAGTYSWNSGMFICRVEQLFGELALQQPVMAAQLETIAAAIGTPDYDATLNRVWGEIQALSIDYAVMEGAQQMAVIPVDMGWTDVGSWASLLDVLDADPQGNACRGEGREPLLIDTQSSLVVSNRLVVTIGVEDLVIVDTDDVLLVCRRDRSQEVREAVDRLKASGDEGYL